MRIRKIIFCVLLWALIPVVGLMSYHRLLKDSELQSSTQAFYRTIMTGWLLVDLGKEYHARNGMFPSPDRLRALAREHFVKLPRPSVLIDAGGIESKIVGEYDNTGGWLYDETNGSLGINRQISISIRDVKGPFDISSVRLGINGTYTISGPSDLSAQIAEVCDALQ